MKKRKMVLAFALALLMLASCGATPDSTQSTTLPDIPETTEVLPETTQAIPETTQTTVEVTIPEGYNYSFFWFTTFSQHSFCNFSIAPAGTQDWCPIYFDESDVCYNHPKIVGGSLEDNVGIVRAYFAYDGEYTEHWVIRIEPPETIPSDLFEHFLYTTEYVWDMEVHLENNKSLVYLWSTDYMEDTSYLSEDDIASGFVPEARAMEFCEQCPASWQTPVG